MSANHLPKLSNALVEGLIFLGLTVLVAVNARIILEHLLASRQIKDEIVSQAAPRLNRNLLMEAVEMISNPSQENLTSIFPAVTVKDEKSGSPVRIEIQNASGITGAATNVGQILIQRGFEVGAISTAPSLRTSTVIIHGTGRAEAARSVAAIIEAEGWPVGSTSEAQDLGTDLVVILGQALVENVEGR